jgi:UDP-N-acetylmuramyl pentapeptide synthase
MWFKRNLQKRGRLVLTKRVQATLLLILPLSLITPPLIPLWIGISNIILAPYFEWVKSSIQKRAQKSFKSKNTKTKVIAIAGSYGKTTTKNYIFELIKYNYKTQMIPGNVNTPTGIANWILTNFDPTSEILIVEVDTYYLGEIKKSLTITPPDIAILTNIGDQHLERFKTKKNLKSALLEIFTYAKANSIHIKDKKTNLENALEVAKILNVPEDIVSDTVKKLQNPDRRGDIKKIYGYTVIDQSYNISFTTAQAAIKSAEEIAHTSNKKLIVITAGIPELGKENIDANRKLGELLAEKSDRTILLKSILYKEVYNDSDKFVLAQDLAEAFSLLTDFDQNNVVVLLLPELNDLYY